MSNAAVISASSGEALIGDLLSGLGEGRAGVVEPGSFSACVIADDGKPCWSDDAFAGLVGDIAGSSEVRRLVKQARRDGRAAGLTPTLRGAVVIEARRRDRLGIWPLPAAAQDAMTGPGERVLIIAFAPSRAPTLAFRAADALGLAPREADLAAALLETPNLAAAALRAGMSGETAKDTLERACRRVGAIGASDLVGRMLDLACTPAESGEGAASALATLGLTVAEGRVATGMAQGWSVAKTADVLGIRPHTVKSHRKAIFAKTGASRDRDLRRLVVEAEALESLVGAAEVVLEDRAIGERLRVLARPAGRRVALIDYGPASGRPLFVMHGFTTGRRLPESFVTRLRADGWRPVVIQRPGFGLTDPAVADFLSESADDMSAVAELLGGGPAAVLARDGEVATAIAFAERSPRAFLRGGVANPRSTRERPSGAAGALASMSRLLLSQPALIAVVAEGFRRRTASAQAQALLQRLYAEPDGARFIAERPDVLDHIVRDIQAMTARTTRGVSDELRLYAEGWRLPPRMPAGPWRVCWGGPGASEVEVAAWRAAGAETSTVEGLRLLGAYTHPDALADLLRD